MYNDQEYVRKTNAERLKFYGVENYDTEEVNAYDYANNEYERQYEIFSNMPGWKVKRVSNPKVRAKNLNRIKNLVAVKILNRETMAISIVYAGMYNGVYDNYDMRKCVDAYKNFLVANFRSLYSDMDEVVLTALNFLCRHRCYDIPKKLPFLEHIASMDDNIIVLDYIKADIT